MPEVSDLLEKHHVALCIADTAGLFPDFDVVTTDFSYVRLHGKTKLYESGYARKTLEKWTERVRRYRKKGDVYVYFDNAKLRAPFDARTLHALVHHTKMESSNRARRSAGLS